MAPISSDNADLTTQVIWESTRDTADCVIVDGDVFSDLKSLEEVFLASVLEASS